MRKSHYAESAIIKAVRELDAGAKAADVAREMGVTVTTLYRWKSKYGGMDVSEAKRLRELEDENKKLKQMVADLSLDLHAVKLVLRKKW